MIRQFLSLFLVAAGVLPADAATKPDIVVDQAIVVMRHGIRAPLDGEVPEGTRTAQPWPRWPVAESPITPHGHRALERVAAADRRRFIRQGLIPARGCPAPAAVTIRSNNSARTIASGDDYAAALLPGCPGTVVHLPAGSADPIFEPLRAGATRFDAAAAIDSIERSTGGVAALAARHRAALALLDGVLACAPRGDGCAPPRPSRVAASADGKGVDLDGPIRTTSGIAQVLLLQYVEGMPRRAVGWGRVDAASLRRMGALHAALFDVFTRPPYMAAHQASALGRDVLDTLAGGTRVRILMGHDTNVTALAAALGIDLTAPGYATNDVAPGGAIVIERARDVGTGRAYVRLFYRTQSPDALRFAGTAIDRTPLPIPGCPNVAGNWCSLDTFSALLNRRIAPLRPTAEK